MANSWASKLALPTNLRVDSQIKQAVHIAIANNAIAESVAIPDKLPPDTIEHADIAADTPASDSLKLTRLIDDDFPFDESQLAAINGMVSQRYACLTGAAGTGKTTTTKKLVDTLLTQRQIASVNMAEYFRQDYTSDDSEDDYEAPQSWVPAVCMVGFTGRSAQMIKKNFPRDWHGNIMTIHRMLAYAPVFNEGILNKETGEKEYFDSKGNPAPKMQFVPTYTADCLLPWDIILIDEAGMVGLDLWHEIWAAAKPGCRIYMIGDINQLPPVHGRSVFGFAMAKWPSWELTHIHRQQGKNNPIVDNAWRVLKGEKPRSEGAFQMIPLKGDAQYASRVVRAMAPKLKERGVYEPNRDAIITPINGEEGSRGFALGQLPLNRELALIFNPKESSTRYIIDGGRERKQFAVGDKVMATRNDYEAGITNGMTGIITSIERHEGYGGDPNRFGPIDEVNAYIRDESNEDDGPEFSLSELESSFEEIERGKQDKKEKAERGPASHIVVVRFGEGEYGFEIPFSTLAEVGSLMTAYVVTCHKMQGGEAPTIIIILHDSHRAMLYREWLYTAITRASQRCIILYAADALSCALSKQSIKGKTLAEKVAAFNALQDKSGPLGAAVKVRLPAAESLENTDVDKTKAIQAVKQPDPPEQVVKEATQLSESVQHERAPDIPKPAKSNPFARLVQGG